MNPFNAPPAPPKNPVHPAPPVLAGYKQTEVGVIPEDWEIYELKDIVQFENGKAHERDLTQYGSYVVVNSKFISSEGQIRKYSNSCFCPTGKNDLLMVMSDVPNGKAIAKCYLVELDNKYTVNQRICSLHSNVTNPKLLFYLVNRNKYYLQFDDGVKQTNLRKENVLSCPIPLPPTLTEQRAIAQALSDTDALIQSLNQLVAKKRLIKQGAMQQLLASPEEGGRRLLGFSGKWKTDKLGERGLFYSGGTPPTSISSYYGGNIKWITSSDLNNKRIDKVNGRITKAGLKNSSAKIVEKGTLLVALYGATAGVTAISNIKAAINQAVLAIVLNKDDTEFFFQKLTYLKDWIIDKYTQGGQPNLSGDIIKSIELSFPPTIAEQQTIAQTLSDMDAEIAALEAKRDKYQQIKQGMMQQLLTGKIRLV